MATGDVVVSTLMLDFRDDGTGEGEGNNGHLSLEQIEGFTYVMWKGGVTITDHQCAGGTISEADTYSKPIDDYIVFSNSNTTSLPAPASGSVEWIPIGQAYSISDSGVVTPTAHQQPSIASDLITATITNNQVALYEVKYTATGPKFEVNTNMPVVVVFAVGTVT